MKSFISILLIVLLLSTQFSSVSLAEGLKDDSSSNMGSSTDVMVKEVKIDKSRILEGDDFTLTLVLEDNSNKSLVDTAIGIEKSSSFRLNKTGSKQSFKFNTEPDNKTATVKFDLTYNGGDDVQLPITLYYRTKGENGEKDSELLSINDYVSVPKAKPNSSIPEDKPRPEVNEAKYTPNISITSSKTVLGEAGDSISVPITIKNVSEYSAYDISSTVELGEDSGIYIDGSGHSDISRLDDGRTKKLSIPVKIDRTAEDKTYSIKVSFQFYNEYGVPFTSTDTVYVKVTNKHPAAQIIVNKVDIQPLGEIQPGSNVLVGFELQNYGSGPVRDIKLSINGLANEGFSLASGLNGQLISILNRGGNSYVQFRLKASNKMKTGSHELKMDLSYKDTKNQEIKDENIFFIPVKSTKDQSSSVIIQNINYPTESIGQNKEVDLSFTIRNQGQTDARNVIVTAESADTAGLVPKSVSVIKLNSLKPGASEKVSYKFLTTKEAETKNYPINIKVEYVDDFSSDDDKYSVDQFVGIFVLSPDDDSTKSVPKLIIDKYSFEPNLVKAGENFEMKLSFFNTNSTKTVKNIKIFLTAEANTGSNPDSPSAGSSVFTPVDSSNTFYMDSIAPKGKVEKTITMFTVPDATAKTHTLTAHFEYEDSKGEPYTATELIGVPVIQKSKLETGELNYSQEAYMGEHASIALEFFNTGKVTLYNMMVKLEGDFQTESGSYYIGNFENGSSEHFEGMVIPSEPGELEGAVVFTFEDSTGQEQELRKEFTLNVMDAAPMGEFPDDFPPVDEGPGGIKGVLKSKWLWGSIVLLASGFGGFKFYKKKKQDKEMALDE